jgi:hypothetical protein
VKPLRAAAKDDGAGIVQLFHDAMAAPRCCAAARRGRALLRTQHRI